MGLFQSILFTSIILSVPLISKNPKLILETTQELSNVSLKVEGNLPAWLEGTFVRNGPIVVYQDGKSFQENARAEVPSVMPRGLHGQFFE